MFLYTLIHAVHTFRIGTRGSMVQRERARAPNFVYHTFNTHVYIQYLYTQLYIHDLVSALCVHGESAAALPSPCLWLCLTTAVLFRYYCLSARILLAHMFPHVCGIFQIIIYFVASFYCCCDLFAAFAPSLHKHKPTHLYEHVAWLLIIIGFGVFEPFFLHSQFTFMLSKWHL